MSLAQHVTSIEGVDCESPRALPHVFAHTLPPLSQLDGGPAAIHSAVPSRVNSLRGIDHESLLLLGSPRLRPKDSRYGTLTSTTSKGLRRVISYDAFINHSRDQQVPVMSDAVVPYEVSITKRLVQVAVTVVSCWLASGIVFGFAALKPILVNEGVYREFCTVEEIDAGVEVCQEQDIRLNAFFAVASTICNISALPAGSLLDKYGPRMTISIGCVFLALGSFLMATAFAIPEFDGYMLGNVFLALGGSFVFVPSFQIANAFPKYSGTIVAMVTGAFDASAAVFLFYHLAYEASGAVFSPQMFFYGYTVVPALILLAQLTIMNGDGYKSAPEMVHKLEKAQDITQDLHDSDDDLSDREVRRRRAQRQEDRETRMAELESLLGDAEERQMREEREEERLAASKVWGALHGKSAWEQITTPWFILITLLTVLQMLRMNFFIATIKTQYEFLLDSPRLAKQVNNFFDVALPVGGVAATPFIGMLLDNMSTAGMLAVLVTMTTCVGVLGALPFLWAAYGNVLVFVLLRPLYYSAMSDYAAKVFGFATFGKVYGMIICISGCINLLQPALDAMNHNTFGGNPTPLNVVFATLVFIFGTVLVLFVWVQGRRVERFELEAIAVATEQDYQPSLAEIHEETLSIDD